MYSNLNYIYRYRHIVGGNDPAGLVADSLSISLALFLSACWNTRDRKYWVNSQIEKNAQGLNTPFKEKLQGVGETHQGHHKGTTKDKEKKRKAKNNAYNEHKKNKNKRGKYWAKQQIMAPSKWKGPNSASVERLKMNWPAQKPWPHPTPQGWAWMPIVRQASSPHIGTNPFANALVSEWQQMRRKRSRIPITWRYNVSWNPQRWGERRLHTDSKIIYLSRQKLNPLLAAPALFFHSLLGYCIFVE